MQETFTFKKFSFKFFIRLSTTRRNREKAKRSKTGEEFCIKYISRKPQDKNIALCAYKKPFSVVCSNCNVWESESGCYIFKRYFFSLTAATFSDTKEKTKDEKFIGKRLKPEKSCRSILWSYNILSINICAKWQNIKVFYCCGEPWKNVEIFTSYYTIGSSVNDEPFLLSCAI